ncbi:MAG: hypothetical protein PHZ07_00375 [Patescibacteria group bacterium]|nr:hypothetical protein [Patescibacteria group bacterium]MDD4304178.1 hypothetical protein [Patescibacteria group bacterium]MDD4695210.1 hypothetical protein [Patescibacteria group bacterium]
MSYNFNTNFNPEFNWQKEAKFKHRKKITKFSLILFCIFVFIFLMQKYYFISDKNITLSSIIPDESKAIFHISNSSKIFNVEKNKSIFSQKTKEKLSYYLNDNTEFTDLFLRSIEDGFYWIEYDNDSQAFLFKVKDLSDIKSKFLETFKSVENYDYRNKKIYKTQVNWEKNKFLPIENNFLYISYLNNYTISVSNSSDLINKIIDKYQDNLRFDYLSSIKDKFNKYFVYYSDIDLKINDYEDIDNSKSWLKDISFIIKDSTDKTFFIKLNNSSKMSELSLSTSENIGDKLKLEEEIKVISKIFGEDFLFYYNSIKSISNVNNTNLGKNIDDYLSVNIGGLYNINLKEDILNIKNPYFFVLYPKDKFVLMANDFDSISNIYRKMLAHYKPLERQMFLPDGSRVTEYYMNANSIDLKMYQDGDLVWYYDDLPSIPSFDMVKCANRYILSNSKNYIYKFCQNGSEIDPDLGFINEIFISNIDNLDNKSNILPFTELFNIKLKNINFIDFGKKNNDVQMIFQFIY